VRLYGTEASEIVGTGFHPIVDGEDLAVEEVDWAISTEGAVTLEDVLYRRTRVALYNPALRERAVEPVAHRMADIMGWDAAHREREVADVRLRLAQDLAFARGEGA
jgi:glycerol-3-phosphate dehydrogenase